MIKTSANNSTTAKAATTAGCNPLLNIYAPHVKVVQYEGRCVRVYGSAVPGKDPVYEDSAGLFCSTHKFMNAVSQALSKVIRQGSSNCNHVFITMDGKQGKVFNCKGSILRVYLTKVESGEGYVFKTRGRDMFFNLIKDKLLCLLRMEAFTGRKHLTQNHGFRAAQIWTTTSNTTTSSSKTIKPVKKSKHDKAVDRREKKRREEREQRRKIQERYNTKQSFRTEQKTFANEYCSPKVTEKQQSKDRTALDPNRTVRVIPPAPKVNPWGVPQKISFSAIGKEKENNCTGLESQKSQPQQEQPLLSPQKNSVNQGIRVPILDKSVLRASVSFTVPSWEDSTFCSLSDATNDSSGWEDWERLSISTVSSGEKSEVPCSSVWLPMSESLLDSGTKRVPNVDAKSFNPASKGESWLHGWLANEVMLEGNTLANLYKTFLEEEMDSKLGLEYLSKLTLLEFKVELADLGVTKKGVLSKLRMGIERLFA